MDNLLQTTGSVLTFDQYAVSDYWTGSIDAAGNPVLTTSVQTVLDVAYELEFNLAANLSADVQSVTIEIWFDGDNVGTFIHTGGVFETYSFDLTGTGELSQLEFKVADSVLTSASSIDTSGVIASYTKAMTFLGTDVTVSAFAPGQNNIYQVLNGQLVKFDITTNTYTDAEIPAAVNINAIGFSVEDDLIYGLARSNGIDATGNAITANDVVAIDATGATYAVSSGQMGSYIGDVDDSGNLWTFNAGLTTAVVYDLSETNPDGSLASQTITLPSMPVATRGLADLAYHAASQTFFGVAHGGATGLPGTLIAIDVSDVARGGVATVSSQTIVGTIVDGQIRNGIPSGAFGATVVDADGNVYIGANNTDHDLDGATPNSGGFYKITTGAGGELYMELLADAPQVSSNDGAMDTRGVDPFLGIDQSSAVLLRAPELSVAIARDDVVQLAAKGDTLVIDLLENDSVAAGDALTLTHLGGAVIAAGDELTLLNGEVVTYLGNGLIEVTPGSVPRDVVADLGYTIRNQGGVTDAATLRIETSPVQGGASDDHIVGFRDSDGTEIDGSDGLNDIVLGYGGNDKIFSGLGDDEIYGGVGQDMIRGQAGHDLILGEAGHDILDGGAGADTMQGGAGNDIYFVDQAGDVVSEQGGDGKDTVKSKVDFVLGADLEDLWLLKGSAAENAIGNALVNMIVGNENDNLIEGLGGDDNLIAGAGDDTVIGGDGDDKLHGGDGADLLDGGAGHDKLHGGLQADSVFGGDGDDTLCPGIGDDVMYGGAGRDLLSGGAGADMAYGGLGNDVYKISDSLDTVVEFAGEGYDVIHASADFSLPDHVEDIIFTGVGDLAGSGNAGSNLIIGNSGNNSLDGAAGDDRINGGSGDDLLSGGAGWDSLRGESGADTLSGGDGNDILSAGDGADRLIGGAGSDMLYGDDGADTFEFAIGDSFDQIKGFDVAQDTIRLIGVTAQDLTWIDDPRGVWCSYGTSDNVLLRDIDMSAIGSIDFLFQ